LFHIHPEPAEIGRIYRPVLGVVSSSPAAVAALAARAAPAERPWREHTLALRRSYLEWTSPPLIPGALQLGEVMKELGRSLPQEAIVANGAGNFAIWPNRFHRYRRFGSMLAPRSGSMGYGIPAAVAAKIQFPDRPVVAFVGDGDFLMTGQELATAMRQGAAIVVLLINNGMYGTIRMHQERDFPGRVSATSLTNPDFVQIAESYGAFAARITRTEEFAPLFEAAMKSGKIALLELVTDPDVIAPTMTISGLRAGRAAMPATEAAEATTMAVQPG
jgi:acetolactate synthase-1/2/3 large subunit